MATSKKRISIIIPIHNAEKFIRITLLALMKIKVPGLEVICVLDRCMDKTQSLIESFFNSINFDDYLLVNVSYGSTAYSRNHGMTLATGKYIAFIDHDDIVDSQIYNRMLSFISTSSGATCDVVRFNYGINEPNGKLKLVEQLPYYEQYPFYGIFVWNGMFKKSFLIKNKIKFHSGYGEDYEFNLSLLKAGALEGRINIKSICYTWNNRGNNLHKKRSAMDFIDRVEAMILRHSKYLSQNIDIRYHMQNWIIDYIIFLFKTGYQYEVAEGYIQNPVVRSFLNDKRLYQQRKPKILRVFLANNTDEFIKLSNFINKKHNAFLRKIAKKFLLYGDTFLKVIKNKRSILYLMIRCFHFAKKSFKLALTFKTNMRIIRKHVAYINKLDKPRALFFCFRKEFISGGLISIYSIAHKFRNSGIEPVLVGGKPGIFTTPLNRLFPNNEIVLPLKYLIRYLRRDFKFVMIPEVKVAEFEKLCKKYHLRFPESTINIMNQNDELMPNKSVIEQLRRYGKEMSVTTAHQQYSTQENADKLQLPLKHLSTYLSYRNYTLNPFSEKENILIYSHDANIMKARVLNTIIEKLPKLQQKQIVGINYSDYKRLASRAKFAITFGESLDNYFIESFFYGGIGFAVYNSLFMPDDFLKFDNVFTSYPEMERAIVPLMLRLMKNDVYRNKLWKANFELLSKIYDDRIYTLKVKQFINGERDFLPNSLLPSHTKKAVGKIITPC